MSNLTEPSTANCFSEQRRETAERVLAVASGALMILPVIGKRSVWRWTAAIAGGALIYQGLSRSRGIPFLSFARNAEHLSQTITINKSPAELYALWRKPDVLARVVEPFGKLTIIGPNHLLWTVATPFGRFEDETVLVEERPDQLVHWRNAGSKLRIDEYMHFRLAPGGRGTEATLSYDIDFSMLPAGPALGAIVSFLQLVPDAVIRKLLRNFKGLAEAGEIATLGRNPSDRVSNLDTEGDPL